MTEKLNVKELRVLGALVEKQVTTPDQYPLTLKALVSACNQKSSREPVMNLSEREVADTVAALEKKYLLSQRTEYGSRVSKHRQRWCNTEFGTLSFTPAELAIMACLMLRGPQTPGELRGRTQRMHAFGDAHEVDETLAALAARSDGPFVCQLEREPGRREARYAHLLGEDEPQAAVAAPRASQPAPSPAPAGRAAQPTGDGDLAGRVARLEETVATLAQDNDRLRAELAELKQSLRHA